VDIVHTIHNEIVQIIIIKYAFSIRSFFLYILYYRDRVSLYFQILLYLVWFHYIIKKKAMYHFTNIINGSIMIGIYDEILRIVIIY